METKTLYKVKICMVGESGVGKTSLIRRYVLDQFSDNYMSTLGTKVMKKQMQFTMANKKKVDLLLTVWDIMGERELMGVVKEAYFHGASGVVAVCDLTREETLPALDQWLQAAKKVVGDVPVILAANKLDLIQPRTIKRLSESLGTFASNYNASEVLTSAKTGENVEIAFKKLGADIMAELMKHTREVESNA